MKKKKRFRIKSKHLLTMMTFICIAAIALTATNLVPVTPIRNAAAFLIQPFQNGINSVGNNLRNIADSMKDKQDLLEENQELQEEISSLREQNTLLQENQEDYERLQELYELDQSYSEYTKVAAQVISKNTSNWYSTFVINRGTEDGIDVDMNVITSGGLVGLITEAGDHWATVRSIIDDNSNVSGMTMSTADNCIVSGDLTLTDEGTLSFSQMNTENDIQTGEKIVTSSISDKYLPGILIGTIDTIGDDSNHLTKEGTIIPAVDFQHIQEVLVITTTKQTGGN